MDELQLRRMVYTNPSQVTDDVQQQINEAPQLQQLQAELQSQDAQLRQALQVSVPVDLQQRLLQLAQNAPPQQASPNTRKHTPRLAIAAAISMLSLSAALWWYQTPSALKVGEQALAHMYHELDALQGTTRVSDTDLDLLLADMQASWQQSTIEVRYARYCHFDGIRSLHMVVSIDGQAVTLFVLPDGHSLQQSPRFADQRFVGESIQIAGRDVVLVAERADLLPKTQQMLMKSLRFS